MILHLGKLMNRGFPPLLELCQYRKTGRSWIWLSPSQPAPRSLPTTALNRPFFVNRDVCLQGSTLAVNLQKTPAPREGCLPWNCLSSLFRPRYPDCHQTLTVKGGTDRAFWIRRVPVCRLSHRANIFENIYKAAPTPAAGG